MVIGSRVQAVIQMPILTSQESGGDMFGALCLGRCEVVLTEQWLKAVGPAIVNFSYTRMMVRVNRFKLEA